MGEQNIENPPNTQTQQFPKDYTTMSKPGWKWEGEHL